MNLLSSSYPILHCQSLVSAVCMSLDFKIFMKRVHCSFIYCMLKKYHLLTILVQKCKKENTLNVNTSLCTVSTVCVTHDHKQAVGCLSGCGSSKQPQGGWVPSKGSGEEQSDTYLLSAITSRHNSADGSMRSLWAAAAGCQRSRAGPVGSAGVRRTSKASAATKVMQRPLLNADRLQW